MLERIEGLYERGGAGLAPMAGVTDAAMRLLCHEQGSAWAVSEMLSAKGWVFSGGKNRNALEIATMATSMLDQVRTNLELNDVINTALLVAGSDVGNIKSFRLPVTGTYKEERREKGGAMLWDCDFATNAVQLYNFIYES